MKHFIYQDEKTKQISFPLGGIGTGCIGLAGNGRFVDMEIFNRPNKGSDGAYSHFAIKVEDEERLLDARVLNSDLQPDYMGSLERPIYMGYGFGPDRATLVGVPHFRHSTFKGTLPIAEIVFEEERFPGEVKMMAFNPFIPTNDLDSSIPGAFFEFEVENTQDKPLSYSIAFSCNNFYAKNTGVHTIHTEGDATYLHLSNSDPRDSLTYGDLTIGTDCKEASVQQYWYRGNWFDNLTTYWHDFNQYGEMKSRTYDGPRKALEIQSNDDLGTLMARVIIPPKEKRTIRFVLTWSMPLMENFWNPPTAEKDQRPWKNYYATVFQSSKESAIYSITHFKRLQEQTVLFRDALFNSSLPKVALDAVSANLAVIKSPTCLRLEDGSLYGFEGCHSDMGSCEGSCTHVWGYTYAVPFLFPKLERSMRTLEYTYSMKESGGMGFRLQLPLGRAVHGFRPCVDGQYVTIMRTYREFKISGDVAWLKGVWDRVKAAIEYAWSDKNYDKWDRDRDGIMEGRQHHTLDMELFGPNAWLSGMYLGGLKAGAKMAKVVGDQQAYDTYMAIFNKGTKRLNAELFNGEYFYQKIALKDKSLLDGYDEVLSLQKQTTEEAYWNLDQGEIMYQIGEGCGIDQILGQWHADLIGLGEIFDEEKVASALQSIYRYNFKEDMHEHFNPCRIYCLNDESGMLICGYPDGKEKPFISAPYAEETMHGFEYQAASHMIARGMEAEGLRCIKAIRDRYDGEKRNPWNEFECGSNYARSMASYALLLIYSGFKCDMSKHMIGFKPLHEEVGNTYFWSVDSGWGRVTFGDGEVKIEVLYGTLGVQEIDLGESSISDVRVGDVKVAHEQSEGTIILEDVVYLREGESIICGLY